MILKKYNKEYANKILKWANEKEAFYKWTAGILGDYPINEEKFNKVDSIIALTAYEDKNLIGFFTFRYPNKTINELRMGFIIVDPKYRGKGYGKKMIVEGLNYAKKVLHAKKVSLAVFENNIPAYYCYKSAGFVDINIEKIEKYKLDGKELRCRNLEVTL
ncbi:GNAT family N-acetyltransferase [Peptostreptococcus equinus]|uniref:GNAT family N-acetyltransferase n=1 Tax=Peptostreptococcus equinus TaxID=3003601 RepID=A0ABY7JLY5_9FIRM|nr:GNAT family N-acetyltransferase [Peptostreptococcus sp. CBA3647]WAW14365.1 GNAT family N-acetyltransferase [Peptostreptococcus sp. CBA3647]